MVAIAVAEDAQFAVEVTFLVELSLYVASAANCWVCPAVTVFVADVTAIEDKMGGACVLLPPLPPHAPSRRRSARLTATPNR
jgi:hypothetical protein